MTRPDVTYLPDMYRFNWAGEEVEITVDRLREDRGDGLRADISVSSQRQPNPGLLLAPTNVGISLPSWRSQVAKQLDAREPAVDWPGLIEQVVYLTAQRWREGDPIINFQKFEPEPGGRWLLKPFLERGAVTVLFAMGGTGKSYLAMAIAVSVATGVPILGFEPEETGPVFYGDWETTPEIHYARMMAICRGHGIDYVPEIHYRRQSASLYESAADLRRRLGELGVVLAVQDSFGAARGGEPESADTTIKGFNAARSLGCANLVVDHVTHAAGDKAEKPFGSVYTHNLARLSWGMLSTEAEDCLAIGLTNHKSNNGRRGGRLGYKVYIDDDEDGLPWMVKYLQTDVTSFRDLAAKLTVKDAAVAIIRQRNGSPILLEDLLEAVKVDMGERAPGTLGSLRAMLNKYKDTFTPVVVDGDRRTWWGLLSSAYA